MFNIKQYETLIKKEIDELFNCKNNDDFIEDILLNDFYNKNKKFVLKTKLIKQIQMKIGKIWQIAIGNYNTFTNLKNGDKSGLDVISKEKQIIIELKNRYNTDNQSSRKMNLIKLAKYKKEHKNFECIYGIINDKTKTGRDKKIIVDDVEVRCLTGDKLLLYIFKDDKETIIELLKSIINSYI